MAYPLGKGKLNLLTQNTSSPGLRNLIILQSSVFEFSQIFLKKLHFAHHATDQQNQLAIAQFLQMEKNIIYMHSTMGYQRTLSVYAAKETKSPQ